jgi:hypothetical protein
MIYYPIVQVITRAAAAWMEFRYQASQDDDVTDDSALQNSASYQAANYLYSVSGPAAGIGFFLIFLFMQPAAYSHLKSRLFCANQEQPTASHALKADILRESHSVCINDIDASDTSDEASQSSVDLDQSPLSRNGIRGFSQDANPGMFGHGRTRSQGGNTGGRNHAGPGGRPLSTDSERLPFRGDYMSDDQGGDFLHGSGAQSKGTSNSASQSYGSSFLPSRLALLDDDELAGLVDKLASRSQQNGEEVNNALVGSLPSSHGSFASPDQMREGSTGSKSTKGSSGTAGSNK